MSKLPPRLLVANRGECACRIARAARRLRLFCAVVYTPADARARHRFAADASYEISDYLNIAAVVDAAKKARADAVHPGYGFLSESPAFAAAVADAGLLFVGPPPAVLEAAGSKAAARRLAAQCGVKTLPGFDDLSADDNVLSAAAEEIGYPLMIKAAKGGGGRGMRIVQTPAAFADALAAARREAAGGFGDDSVILEKYVARARHLEAQLLCDSGGRVLILGERECSLQRRQQKLIEESPAPNLPPEMRERLHEAARKLARAVAYRTVGTVEFLLDEADGELYFLEINARLQVEHPVTELTHGVDLVEWQYRTAAGEMLPEGGFGAAKGAAIEARICAEDAFNNFLPAAGVLRRCDFAAGGGGGARVDAGIGAGDVVSGDYDSLLAKIISYGGDRAEALARLRDALAQTHIAGAPANTAFLHALTLSPEFAAGRVWTAMISERMADFAADLRRRRDTLAVLAAARALFAPAAGWPVAAFRLNTNAETILLLTCGGNRRDLTARQTAAAACEVCLTGGGETSQWTLTQVALCGETISADIAGERHSALCETTASGEWRLFADGLAVDFAPPQPAREAAGAPAGAATAPMSAIVASVAVAAGDKVEQGGELMTLEAMKMEMPVLAGKSGRVAAVHYRAGDRVAAGAVLVELEETPADAGGGVV